MNQRCRRPLCSVTLLPPLAHIRDVPEWILGSAFVALLLTLPVDDEAGRGGANHQCLCQVPTSRLAPTSQVSRVPLNFVINSEVYASLSLALRVTTILRMTAVMATIGFFPFAQRRV